MTKRVNHYYHLECLAKGRGHEWHRFSDLIKGIASPTKTASVTAPLLFGPRSSRGRRATMACVALPVLDGGVLGVRVLVTMPFNP